MSLFLFLWLCCWCELFRMLFDKENDKRGRPAWPTVSHHCFSGWSVPVSPKTVGELIDSVSPRSRTTTLHYLMDERSGEILFHIEWNSLNKHHCCDMYTCRQIYVCIYYFFPFRICMLTNASRDRSTCVRACDKTNRQSSIDTSCMLLLSRFAGILVVVSVRQSRAGECADRFWLRWQQLLPQRLVSVRWPFRITIDRHQIDCLYTQSLASRWSNSHRHCCVHLTQ